jgi:hypothetical protein
MLLVFWLSLVTVILGMKSYANVIHLEMTLLAWTDYHMVFNRLFPTTELYASKWETTSGTTALIRKGCFGLASVLSVVSATPDRLLSNP